MSPQGGHVLYISATGEGQVLGECAVGQYSDNNGQCLNCNPSCAYCDGSQDLCYSCQESYYLDTNTCLACSFACKVC